MSASPENRPSTSSAKFNLAQILTPKSPKLLTYKAKIPKSNNKSAMLPVLSSQNHSPDLLHQTLSPVSHLKLELHENTPSNDHLETGSGLIRDPTPTANSKGTLAPPCLSPSFSGYNLYRQHKQNRALRVNTSGTPLRDFLSCTPSPTSATLNTHGNISPVPKPSKFEESSKLEPSRPGTKQGEPNILGLTAIGFESPVKRPIRPRLTQVGKHQKNNFLSGLVSPINLASTQKIRKSIGFVQERVENTNGNEESPKKADGIRKPIRHRTLPLSLNNSPQASGFLNPSFNVNKSGRKSEMRESPNPSGCESNKNLLSVPKKFDEGRRGSGRQSLLPFLRAPSPADFDNKTPEGSTNTSTMKSKLPQEVFSEIVDFQNNKMPFHMTWNAETRQRLFTEIKKKASDRGNLDAIWNIREIEVPQEKDKFLEKKIDKMVEQKKKDIGSRSPVKSALYQFYALDGNTRKKIKGKLQQQLAQEPRFFDLQ